MDWAKKYFQIDHVYCINMDSHQDRWNHLQQRFQSMNMKSPTRWSAVEGKKIKDHPSMNSILSYRTLQMIQGNIQRRSHFDISSWAEIGCALSHASLWNHMIKHDIEKMIIMEDDVIPHGLMEISTIQNEIHSLNWDIFFFGSHPFGNYKHNNSSLYCCQLEGSIIGAHAYIIRKNTAKILLQFIFPIEMQVDSFMGHFSFHSNDEKNIPKLNIWFTKKNHSFHAPLSIWPFESTLSHGECKGCELPWGAIHFYMDNHPWIYVGILVGIIMLFLLIGYSLLNFFPNLLGNKSF